MTRHRVCALGLAPLEFWNCSRKTPTPTPSDASGAVRTAVAAPKPAFAREDGERGHQLWRAEQRFYEQNGYQLVWTSGGRPRAQMDSLIRALRAADKDGLDPASYHVDEVDALRPTTRSRDDRQKRIDLDLRATYAYLRMAWDLSNATISRSTNEGGRFVFPNHFNAYLHDTPAHALFDRIERDFSHGCVRLERPMDLAQYVLRDQPEWTEEKISEAMHAGVERSVSLREPLPIYLVYFAAWEEDGALKMVPDIDAHDGRHDAPAASQ